MANPPVTSGDQVRQAQIDYLTWMANYAHSKGMVIGLKNALGIRYKRIPPVDSLIAKLV